VLGHIVLGRFNVRPFQLFRVLKHSAQKDEFLIGVSEIQDAKPGLSKPCPKLSQPALDLRGIRERQGRPMLLQFGDQSKELGATLLWQTIEKYFYGRAAIRVFVEVYDPCHDL